MGREGVECKYFCRYVIVSRYADDEVALRLTDNNRIGDRRVARSIERAGRPERPVRQRRGDVGRSQDLERPTGETVSDVENQIRAENVESAELGDGQRHYFNRTVHQQFVCPSEAGTE